MKKNIYSHPVTRVVILKSENFICLSVPIATGAGPGGGGDAKRGFFEEEDNDEDVSTHKFSLWEY